jgi:hypothetical protein
MGQVEWRAGCRAGEDPRVIEIDGRRLRVLDIPRRWYAEHGCHFKVLTDDGQGYLLRHDEHGEVWSVVEVVPAGG